MKTQKEKPYGFWNWGTGITLTIIICGCLMMWLVYKSTQVTFDMATTDYYAEELKFNAKMKAAENAESLSEPVSITQKDEQVIIHFPRECHDNTQNGSLVLYRPSDQRKDLHIHFAPDEHGNIVIAGSRLIKGMYKLKADWEMNKTPYSIEKDFYYSIP